MNAPSADAFWATPITYLTGVGPKRAEALASELGVRCFGDLLHHLPFRHVHRDRVTRLDQLTESQDDGQTITVIGTLGSFHTVPGRRKRLSATLRDGHGSIDLLWFEGVSSVSKSYKEGETVVAYGKVGFYQGRPRLIHPELECLKAAPNSTHTLEADQFATLPILPVYSSTDILRRLGLEARGLRRLMWSLLVQAPEPIETDPLPAGLLVKERLMSRSEALREVHFAPSAERLAAAQHRLKFDELLFFQLILASRRTHRQKDRRAIPFERVGELFHRFYEKHLPFALTDAQKRVVKEIRADLAKAEPMNRLVQGDVGSGKTMVALLSVLIALDNGCQVAVLAPTEILAEQHRRSFGRYLEPLGVQVELLTGSTRAAERADILGGLSSGTTHVVIGTHALIEPVVRFASLGLTVIDEQHKFGVLQRSALWGKAEDPARPDTARRYPHNLALTATPIPRTLALTAYGEVEVSAINELPPGRKPIRTVLRTEAHRLRVLGFLQEQIEAGRQVYVVYPLIETSAKTDLLAAESGFAFLQRYFMGKARVGLLHGRMKGAEKDAVMTRFVSGQVQVLVATTVIEVGVDVPNATVMLIENPERFGLSQLHQLRGRVGRGGEQSFCILLAADSISRDSRTRLKAMVETNDGFRIAEVDLALRGPGDFLGTRQSGLPNFAVADLIGDAELVERTRQLAQQIITVDPGLARPELTPLRLAVEAYARQQQLDLRLA